MGITRNLESLFDPRVRSRGREYFWDDKVEIISRTPERVVAGVRGRSTYRVYIFWDGQALRMSCTCPYFAADNEPCKHIWAVLCLSEASQMLAAVPRSGPETVILGPEAETSADFSLEEEDDGELDAGRDDGMNPYEGTAPYEDDEEDDILPSRPEDLDLRARLLALDGAPPTGSRGRGPASRRPLNWKVRLGELQGLLAQGPPGLPDARKELTYSLEREETLERGSMVLTIEERKRLRNGDWSSSRPWSLTRERAAELRDPADQRVCALLQGAPGADSHPWAAYEYAYGSNFGPRWKFLLGTELYTELLPILARTGRFRIRHARAPEPEVLTWDDGPPWDLRLKVQASEDEKHWILSGFLLRGEETIDLAEPHLLLAGGFVFARGRVARLDDHGAFPWILDLRGRGQIKVPRKHEEALLQSIWGIPRVPPVELPEPLRLREVALPPRAGLTLRLPGNALGPAARLQSEVSFSYGETSVRPASPGDQVIDIPGRSLVRRDRAAEKAALDLLVELGFRRPPYHAVRGASPLPCDYELAPRHLPRVVRKLLDSGWRVEAEGKLYRRPGNFQIDVATGIDWFDLDVKVDFDGQVAKLPALLAALRRGETTVLLDDGTFGMLPEEWLRKHALLVGAGKVEGDRVRFRPNQILLLEALVAGQEQASWDERFERARDELRNFSGLQAGEEPPGFRGTLRPYQKEGLGWMEFLRRFGFGGCLADDMGLGKTIQVLALLEARRAAAAGAWSLPAGKGTPAGKRPPRRPSLVVVPRSLIFNWKNEAARFAPELRVLDHSGADRARTAVGFEDYDLVLTTYGILRRDAAILKDHRFDYAILDEAQTVKNARSLGARAARLLEADHRLALSGTPVENHLGELWSLFEFLNPGMLGSASVFQKMARNARRIDDESRRLLARALRPFILRRTKGQVATELPEKLEQTVYCDLDEEERKLYTELRDHYRSRLVGKAAAAPDAGQSKMQVLEALLRLRQAACHAGLLDRSRSGGSSAKLEVLLDRLREVRDEGHKALVFSQFTSLLAIVRKKLDEEGIPYEYLDGGTRDRQARVVRFQGDPDCKLFLISLKAGGLGLNLTAAEYVFLLDPWWNPAAEAQAIDRAHRIGQSRRVFAFRLIARDTVEEKVLELQKSKRELADAIINADNSLIAGLTREDLELLLS